MCLVNLAPELADVIGDVQPHRVVADIIQRNWEKGRIQQVAEDSSNAASYVKRVEEHYRRLHRYVQKVQVEKASSVWQDLYDLLKRWAYAFLQRRSFPPAASTRPEHAATCATEAALVILNTDFPYDVEFQPWAYNLLKYICLRHIRAWWQMQAIGGIELLALSATDNWMETVPDPSAERQLIQVEQRVSLERSISRLSSSARQRFIHLYYFMDWTFEEIADITGKSKNTLYKLHYDTLRELRKVWGIEA